MIISWDPGLTTGYATFSNHGIPIELGDLKASELFDFMESFKIPEGELNTVIVEDYRIFSNKAQAHILKKLTAPKVIGSLEYWAHINGCEFILQTPSTKEMGYRYANIAKAANHNFSHSLDAYAHGVFYIVNRKITTAESFRKASNGSNN
jgi:hypothetical protein